jgi:tetratricopeptide (TPR) repeat protein
MSKLDYLGFELRIGKQSEAGTYPVTAQVPFETSQIKSVFSMPYVDKEIARARNWMEQGRFDTDYVKAFGAGLFQALFHGQLKDVYQNCHQRGTALRFRLRIEEPLLVHIPWELMYDPERKVFLSLDGPFVRSLGLTVDTPLSEVRPPLRILVIDAFPEGVNRVDNQIEATHIRQSLTELVERRQVDVESLSHASLDELKNILREAANPERAQPFHLLHFIGYGQHNLVTGRTVLLFEGDQGQAVEVDAEALMNILRPYNLKLVFLNICRSNRTTTLDVSQEFAPALLSSGVPAVVAMHMTILDKVAIHFLRSFYTALTDNQSVDAALANARQLVHASHQGNTADMGVPNCYLRAKTGHILQLQPAAWHHLPYKSVGLWLRKQATPRRVLAGLLSIITVVGTVLGLYADGSQIFSSLLPTSTQPLSTPVRLMSKDFNIAVAKFAQLDSQNRVIKSEEAEKLSVLVSNELTAALEHEKHGALAGYEIEIRTPTEIDIIDGATSEVRAQAAKNLADQIKADMVIYGYLNSDNTTLVVEFYLSDRKLRGAEELAGSYEMGDDINVDDDITKNVFASKDLREKLTTRTVVMARFMIGLGYFAVDRFSEAKRYFQDAEDTPGWAETESGKEVLYLFQGSTAGQLRDLQLAKTYYARALQSKPGYTRALLGSAEVLFQQSRGKCKQGTGTDIVGLHKAIDGYQSALAGSSRPTPYLFTKLEFYLGRAHLCLGNAGEPGEPLNWTTAQLEFERVIAEFESGKTEVQNLAAEAHANLGLIAFLTASDPNHPPASEIQRESIYRRAATEINAAITLSHLKDRHAIFYLRLAQIDLRLRECDEANAALAKSDESFASITDPISDDDEAFRAKVQQERADSQC